MTNQVTKERAVIVPWTVVPYGEPTEGISRILLPEPKLTGHENLELCRRLIRPRQNQWLWLQGRRKLVTNANSHWFVWWANSKGWLAKSIWIPFTARMDSHCGFSRILCKMYQIPDIGIKGWKHKSIQILTCWLTGEQPSGCRWYWDGLTQY